VLRTTEFLDIFTSSVILGARKHNVSETGCFRPHVCGGKTPIQVGPLDTANLNPSDPVSEAPRFLVPRITNDVKKSKKLGNCECDASLSEHFRIH
jgi:hypothetical protein